MPEVLNLDAIHNNGKARLVIGIRNSKFTLELDSDNETVTLYNEKTNDLLNLKVNSIIADGIMTYNGKFNTYQDLLDAVANGMIHPVKGWVVFIMMRGGLDASGDYITDNTHLVYTGEGWQTL